MKAVSYLALGLAAFGCGPKKAAAPAKVTLTWSLFGAQLYTAYSQITASDDFKAKFPNVTVVFNDAPDPTLPNGIPAGANAVRVPTCVQNNNCFDIEELENAYAAQVFPSGSFIALNKYDVDLSQEPPVSASVVTAADGSILGIPIDTAPMVMFYRVDLIGQALATLNGTSYPPAGTDLATYNKNVVEPYMNNLTWDQYIMELSPLLFTTTVTTPHVDSDYNQGYPVFPIDTLEGLSFQMFPEQTNWLKDGQLNPDLIPFINKYVRYLAMLYRGQGSGAPATDVASAAAARQKSFVADLHWTDKGTDLCGNTQGLVYADTGFFGGGSVTCQLETGQSAVLIGAAWRGESTKSWQSGIAPATPDIGTAAAADSTGAIARENRLAAAGSQPAWANGLWRATTTPGIKAGDGITANIDHLYSLDGGSYVGVTKACKNPDVAVAVIKYFTQTIAAQINNFNSFQGFPAYEPAWTDPALQSVDPFFGNESFTPANTAALDGVNSTGTRVIKQGQCQNQIGGAFTTTVNNVVTLDTVALETSVAGAGPADLQDSAITALQGEVINQFQTAIAALLADPTACTTFSASR